MFPAIPDSMTPREAEWGSYSIYIGQVTSLHQAFKFSLSRNPSHAAPGNLEFAALLLSAGFYLYEQSLANPCREVLATALEICERSSQTQPATLSPSVLDPTQSAQAEQLEAKAATLMWAGLGTTGGILERRESIKYLQRSLEIRERQVRVAQSEDAIFKARFQLSSAYNDMGVHLIDCGKYTEAIGYLHRSLDLKVELATTESIPDHKFAISKLNLALAHLADGAHQPALQLSEEAVELGLREYEDGAAVAWLRFAAANCLFRAGMIAEALVIFEEVLQTRTSLFGDYRTPTRNALYAVAIAQYKLGKFDEAM